MTVGHTIGHVKRRLAARGLMEEVVWIAAAYGVSIEGVVSPKRAPMHDDVRRARAALWHVLSAKYQMSTTEIGKIVGRPQSTVADAIVRAKLEKVTCGYFKDLA